MIFSNKQIMEITKQSDQIRTHYGSVLHELTIHCEWLHKCQETLTALH